MVGKQPHRPSDPYGLGCFTKEPIMAKKSVSVSAPESAFTAIANVVVTEATATATANSVSSASLSLDELRTASAKAARTEYGAVRDYALRLCEQFKIDFWRKSSVSFKAWQEEKAKYDAELKALGHSNPSQAHKNVLGHATKYFYPEKGTGAALTLSTRAVKESVALYNALVKEEKKSGLDNVEQRIFSHLCTFMKDGLKLDLNNLPKN